MRAISTSTVVVLLALSLATCTRPNPYLNVCGNGVLEHDNDEECDDGPNNANDAPCTAAVAPERPRAWVSELHGRVPPSTSRLDARLAFGLAG